MLRFSTSSSSLPTDRTVIATTPGPLNIPGTPEKAQGVFDGLCVDGLGNVWVARWSDERIVGYTPEGEVICYIWTKGCKSPTIPCFGGESSTADPHCQLAKRRPEPQWIGREDRKGGMESVTVRAKRTVARLKEETQFIKCISMRDRADARKGKNLDIMYIASAHSSLAGQGDQQDKYPYSGAVYKVDFGPGSEVRKYLPDNWTGAERFRFSG